MSRKYQDGDKVLPKLSSRRKCCQWRSINEEKFSHLEITGHDDDGYMWDFIDTDGDVMADCCAPGCYKTSDLIPYQAPATTMESNGIKVGQHVVFVTSCIQDGRAFMAGEKYRVLEIRNDQYERLHIVIDTSTKDDPNGKKTYLIGSENFHCLKAADIAPKITLNSVIMSDEKREHIMEAVSQLKHSDLIFNKWGFGKTMEKGTAVSLLFYGPPGTGKTMVAQAIAEENGMLLKVIQTAEVQSSEPGGTERNIKGMFQQAMQHNWLLLFDECDSLIYERSEVGMILAAEINALLSSLETFTGIAIFTTNRLGKMDAAFERRVSAKIHFPPPDLEQRKAIWRRMIPKEAPLDPKLNLDDLADVEFSGGHIKNCVLTAARRAAYKEKSMIDLDCFLYAIEREYESIQEFKEAHKKEPHIRMGYSEDVVQSGGKTLGKTMKRDMIAAASNHSNK